MADWVGIAVAIGIIVTAILHLSALAQAPNWRYYLFKPMPILLMAIGVVMFAKPSFFMWLIVAGLVLSAVGDVFLMLPKDKFIQGLLAFLIAHLFYSVAFWGQVGAEMVWWLPAVLFSAGIMIVLLLLPDLKSMLIPVTVYMLVIIQMAWAAGEYYLTTSTLASSFAFVGALSFLFSDLTLAMNRFRQKSLTKEYLIMTSYYLAQGAIAYSAIAA